MTLLKATVTNFQDPILVNEDDLQRPLVILPNIYNGIIAKSSMVDV